jgi:hypothetical protein
MSVKARMISNMYKTFLNNENTICKNVVILRMILTKKQLKCIITLLIKLIK